MKASILPLLTTTLLVGLFYSCNNTKNKSYLAQLEVSEELHNHPGKKLLETKCYVCHNPSTNIDNRIAPPMVAIKSHYINNTNTKEEFTNAIWNFVMQPSEDKTKMRGAVRRFGVMPYQPFLEEDIKLISEYIYDFKIDEPEWFKEHIKNQGNGKMQHSNEGKE